MDAANELTRPLGLDREARKAAASRSAARTARIAGVLAFGAIGCVAVYASLRGVSFRADEPMVPRMAEAPAAAQRSPVPAPVPSGPTRHEASELESAAGVAVIRPAGTAAPQAVIVRIPDEIALAPAPDPRLVEASRHGELPRIGRDGARAIEVYARPAGELPGGALPTARVAIVVGGLGISAGATAAAIDRLPPAVTLAFAPYGGDLGRDAARARAAGHELVLQVPMEPFDSPAGNPGPRTLTTNARPSDNMEHLHWALARFPGYVAVMNHMGAKLTADAKALAPLLREVGERGLGVVDDGSSPRSLIGSLAGATPAARAELVLDAVPRADLIDKALGRLEAAAAAGGVAVATASALPVTIERIERWAKGLEARGILLTPASAAFGQRPGESARR